MSVGLELIGKGRTVRITWPDRPGQEVSARWLYDHGAGGRDPVSGQRGHGARALEAPIRIETVEVADGGLQALFAPSGETRWIALDRLAADPEPERHPAEEWLTPAPIESARRCPSEPISPATRPCVRPCHASRIMGWR